MREAQALAMPDTDPRRVEPSPPDTAPIALVPRKTASEEIKQQAIKILRAALARVEAGDIDFILLVERNPNGFWRWNDTDMRVGFCETIGRLEVIQQEMIASYLRENA